jgi:hypothetical protein
MHDIEKPSAHSEAARGAERFPLMKRTMRERWEIPDSLRGALVAKLSNIINDPNSAHREVLSAVSAILAVSKINLANIGLMLKVQEYEDLEQRITELERLIKPQTDGGRAP